MYNLLGLWVRWLWIVFLCISGAVVLFVSRKSIGKQTTVIACLILVILFMYSSYSMLKSVKKPQITSFIGVFHSETRRKGISPLEYEYCFETENGRKYVDMDAISKRIVYSPAFVVGESYEIVYEKTQNLIVGISKTGDGAAS